MSCIERLSKRLRLQGFRVTPQRLVILQALHDGGHLSPQQVYERVSQQMPGITEATIYRTLDFMAKKDILLSTNTNTGHLVYELAGSGHHHLVCRACGGSASVEDTLIQGLFNELEAVTGFRPVTGHLTLFGLCSTCKNGTGSEG